LVVSAAAQETVQLSEAEAVDRAVSENLSLRSQRTSLSVTERETETAWNRLIPSVTASARMNRSNEAMGGGPSLPGEASVEEYHATFGASVNAQLTLVASIADEIDAASHNLAASRLSYEQATEQTAERVRTIYYSILLGEERIAVRERAVETAEQNLEQVEASFDEGRVDTRTVRQAELRLEQSRLQLQQSRAELDNALGTFRGLLGIEPDRSLELTGSLRVADEESQPLPELSPGARPDVARLSSQIDSQNERVEAAEKNRFWPSLSLSASYSPGLPDPFDPDNPPDKEWSDSGSVSVSIAFGLERLLPFSQEAVALESAQKRAAALQLDRQAAVESARREYASLVRAVENARAAVASQQLNVSLNEEVVDLTEEAYQAGQTDFVSLQEAQVSLAEARLALLNEVYNLRTSLIELEYAAGHPSVEE
jgi:outer membrane protein TolC